MAGCPQLSEAAGPSGEGGERTRNEGVRGGKSVVEEEGGLL